MHEIYIAAHGENEGCHVPQYNSVCQDLKD